MPGVHCAVRGVQEVVVDEHLVPGTDEIGIEIVCVLEVSVHTQESRQCTIDGVMERNTVQAIMADITKEVLVHLGRDVCRVQETRRLLRRCTTTTAVKRNHENFARGEHICDVLIKRTKRVTSGDFSSDQEISFAETGSTLSGTCSPFRQSIQRHLCGLVDTDGIDVERGDGHASEYFQLCHDSRSPFSQTILYGGELRQLTLPVRMHTEGLHVTILIEVGFSATSGPINVTILDSAVVAPESREDT